MTKFIITVLTKWIIGGQDFDQLLDLELQTASIDRSLWDKYREEAKSDQRRLQHADMNELTNLRGNPERLRQEVAAILRW